MNGNRFGSSKHARAVENSSAASWIGMMRVRLLGRRYQMKLNANIYGNFATYKGVEFFLGYDRRRDFHCYPNAEPEMWPFCWLGRRL